MEQLESENRVKEEAREYLTSLINKNLRVTSADGRIFWGQFKCIDPDSNIVLSQTYEYRQPSASKRLEAAQLAGDAASVKLDMTSRFLGLVVVPGKEIAKVELEEFASQMRKPTARTGAQHMQKGPPQEGIPPPGRTGSDM